MASCFLVADIGGTNARFAVVDERSHALQHIRVLACNDYENIDQAILAYLEQVGVAEIERAAIALACPVDVAHIRMTNNHWNFVPKVLQDTLKLTELKLFNDFTAMALGMLEVDEQHLIELLPGARQPSHYPRMVVGPGTGLGVSTLIPYQQGWHALSTEGGHVSFAPTDDLSLAIWKALMARHGRVSVERILSGQGLINTYLIVCDYFDVTPVATSPAEVTALALADDWHAKLTLNKFCQILGEVAGDAVLLVGAKGGVYLCGGILPRIIDFVKRSDFIQGFYHKGRFENYLKEVPVWLCTAEYPGLLGCAAAFKSS